MARARGSRWEGRKALREYTPNSFRVISRSPQNPPNMSFVLAVDLGTSSVRAVVFSKAGAIVGSAQQEYPMHNEGGVAEQDGGLIWAATAQVRASGCAV